MRRLLAFVAATFLGLASTAFADPRDAQQPFAISERPSAGLFLGVTLNGDPNQGGGGGGEAGFALDAPIRSGPGRVRFDATRTFWHGQQGEGRYFAADRITLTTLRLSLVNVTHPSQHVASYGGFGFGWYHYDYAHTPVVRRRWSEGIHCVFGLEFLRHGDRSAIDAEVRVHAMGGPETRPETQAFMFKSDAAVGMKLRF